MKKAQSSLFVLIGLAVLILVSIFFVSLSGRKQVNFEAKNYDGLTELRMREDISENINFCIENSVRTTMQDTGIRQETLVEYESLTTTRIDNCVSPLIEELERQEYDVDEGNIIVDINLNPEAIVVEVDYPTKIEKGDRLIQFTDFHYTFDRSATVKIPGGITDDEIIVVSPDDRAEIVIPPGVEIRDQEGNLVDEIGLKVDDLHFGGLENKHVVGQLVYEGYPDVTFSKPVQLSLDFREEDIGDIPEEESIAVSYWDEDNQVWYAFPTEIHDGVATANVTHLSFWTINRWLPRYFITEEFNTRFTPTGGSPTEGEKIWLIGGREYSKEGTVSFQINWDFERLRAREDYEDWKETLEEIKDDYISFPVTEFGYYINPENPNSEFINCEESQEMYGVEYLMKDGYPYYKVCNPGVENAVRCEGCGDYEYSLNYLECNPICNGTMMGDSPGQPGKICVPISSGSKRCKIRDECIEREGWHNLQCNGGRVLPGDEDAASFFTCEGNGNCVIYHLVVQEYPNGPNEFTYADFKSVLGQGFDTSPFAFYCDIKPFPGEEGKTFQDYLGTQHSNFELSDGSAAWGVYGVDIFKRVDHDNARISTNAQCELIWEIKGKGDITFNNPNAVSGQEFIKKKIEERRNSNN